MTLHDYLHAKRMTPSQFAAVIGRPSETVRRYCLGGRIPAPDVMRQIVEATRGKVTLRDFMDEYGAPRPIKTGEAA